MKKLLVASAVVISMVSSASISSALSIDAVLTADNHYALYHGNESGSDLHYVGQNETGTLGSGVGNNWSEAESWSFDMTRGDYIYVVAWSDDFYAQGWLGQFDYGEGVIYSNTNDWEFFAANNNINEGGWSGVYEADLVDKLNDPPTWTAVLDSIDHGSGPWGVITGISPVADWIWGGQMNPGVNVGEYLVFRTKVDPVPEPATMLLFGAGLAGLAGSMRRRKK